MKPMVISKIARYTEGNISGSLEKDKLINHVTIDSRQSRKGSLFIPLKGNQWDGHSFIKDAAKQGATACLYEPALYAKEDIPSNMIGIAVENCQKALECLASHYREEFSIPFIAITGSNGKTTTKDMTAAVLSSKYQVLKNPGNYNNHIGLPLSILGLDHNHQVAVLEMGMSGAGEIGLLSKITKPDYAVVTNIGMAHVENLGSRLNIAYAKKEITEGLCSKGTLLLNKEDDYYDVLYNDHAKDYEITSVGLKDKTTFHACDIEDLGQDGFKFRTNETGDFFFYVRQPGMHNITNALFAIKIALLFGLKNKEIQNGLNNLKPAAMRMEICRLHHADVVNDAYNANPDSMKAAIQFISQYPAERRIAVLGDMYELGEHSESAHKEIGNEMVKKQIDHLITVGDFASWIASEAIAQGMDSRMINNTKDYKEAANILNKMIRKGDVVLLKASRKMALEKMIRLLQEGEK
ncbi:UDP-N-acetylmuramoyl-tripeptide--D-alanyl-D-alanine ligase [Tindallia californiensis]|uniref:UDP-N-acetylmuramoyl-tripeptide--D-alanyl-D-alanine ligase n=1 Tax=Tindallia californiensis TaxID=159292 RepID=A0A1H3JQ18_9FIRM|nr:UDP-N-acetylmuramoyl-tripeptide--D-alanyl-D-alanine ligase [Tindallia californiensis]SDY42001.1 UDP-N-acetylmuramoyl-tripeptide--D-alanyl-D-alanine ligase [Tindallia californiensis]